MSVAKVIEVKASSNKSFDDAVVQGIARDADSLEDVAGAWIQDQQVTVSKGKITEYRGTLKVTVVLKKN